MNTTMSNIAQNTRHCVSRSSRQPLKAFRNGNGTSTTKRSLHSVTDSATLSTSAAREWGESSGRSYSSTGGVAQEELNIAANYGYRTVSPLEASRYTCTEPWRNAVSSTSTLQNKPTVSVLGDLNRAGYCTHHSEESMTSSSSRCGWRGVLEEEQPQGEFEVHGRTVLLNDSLVNEWKRSNRRMMGGSEDYYESEK